MAPLRNVRHEKFAQLVASGYRKDEAFRQAGFTGKYKTSPHPPMARPDVSARVDELVAKGADRAQVTIDKVVRELACIAFSNPQDFITDDGVPLELAQLTRDQAAAVQDLSVIEQYDKNGKVTSRRYRYRLHDKQVALEKLGRHLGVFAPDTNLNVNVNNVADGEKDREELKRIFTRLIDARKADEAAGIFRDSTGNVITDPERLKIEQDIYASKQQRDRVLTEDPMDQSTRPVPLRLVSPSQSAPMGSSVKTPSPTVESAPLPVEDRPLTTTEAFYAWSSKPRNPFE